MPDRCKFARGRMITFFIATLMTTLKPDNHTEVQSDFGYGMLAGILGGACFGFIMQLTGMMGRYAEIVGGYKDIDGWFVHIVVSAILGAIYGAAGYRISKSWLVSGLAYGLIWWVLGSLIAIPALMGVGIFYFNAFAWWALLGNLIFGLLTAGVFVMMSRGYGQLVIPQRHSS